MPYLVAPAVPTGRMSSRPQPSLRSEPLLLRPWREQDAPVLTAAYAEDDIQRWHARTLDSPREARDLIDEWNRGWTAESAARWAVVDTISIKLWGRQRCGQSALHHSVLNGPSCRVAVKAGFVLEGTMQEKALHTDGRHDMHLARQASECQVSGMIRLG